MTKVFKFLLIGALLVGVFVAISGYLVRRDLRQSGVSPARKMFAEGKRIGVLEVEGVIREAPAKKWLKSLKQFREDDSIKAIVLRINSPGGAVAPSQELYSEIQKTAATKPVVASMASVAASGGYYIAVAAPKIFANPGTITGSIGVIMEFANLEKLYDWAKISRFSIKTGKFKDAGADYRKMDPEERRLLQAMIDSTLVDFKAAVARGRKLKPEQVDAVADGRVFSGSQAKAAGLVDELGGIQEALAAAAKQAKIEGEPRVVYPQKTERGGIIRLLLEGLGERDRDDEEASWISGLIRAALSGHIGAEPRSPGIYWLLPWAS